ncbi:alpha-1,3-glucosyltransferase, glycosyltransferase family 57 protein [Pseudohyphozyma bogoriensis]|nr:alpha-1,3-glucosyltransferase, glycosyltransferase family 57 protein [Pseudohyphozyma bogoriensis]
MDSERRRRRSPSPPLLAPTAIRPHEQQHQPERLLFPSSSHASLKAPTASPVDPPPYPHKRKHREHSTAPSVRSVSTGAGGGAPISRQLPLPRAASAASSSYQPLAFPSLTDKKSRSSLVSDSRPSRHPRAPTDGAASESGASVLSAFRPAARLARDGDGDERSRRKQKKQSTDSPLRAFVKWLARTGLATRWQLAVVLGVIVAVKCAVGLGGYSGANTPPLRGDFEAQRHWLALTSSSLTNPIFHPATLPERVPLSQWYYRDLAYWGLDYPPLTAYHSLLLGSIARLSPHTAPFVTLRPNAQSNETTVEQLDQWQGKMARLETEGAMKAWLRGAVIIGDLLVWPALLLIDNGHFQYNSIMLGLTLWAVNFCQANHHLLGAAAFVASLGFKQMALFSFLVSLSFVTISSFALLFAPFLSPFVLPQVIHRIFPFARGLFEDKVANFWCALNVVVKLRTLASVPTLAKLALLATLLAILPGTLGMLWVSHEAGKREEDGSAESRRKEDRTTPTVILLPHALFTAAMAFFLFSFQVHEKSILLPLMPLTVLMGGREAGFGRMDWEWSVLLNNVGVFSMWPLLKKDGLGLQYLVLTLAWNFAIGYNPFALRSSFVKLLSLAAYGTLILIHLLEILSSPPPHLPDLFPVLNLTLSAGVFGIGFLWATKRSVQEGWSVVGAFHAHEKVKTK